MSASQETLCGLFLHAAEPLGFRLNRETGWIDHRSGRVQFRIVWPMGSVDPTAEIMSTDPKRNRLSPDVAIPFPSDDPRPRAAREWIKSVIATSVALMADSCIVEYVTELRKAREDEKPNDAG